MNSNTAAPNSRHVGKYVMPKTASSQVGRHLKYNSRPMAALPRVCWVNASATNNANTSCKGVLIWDSINLARSYKSRVTHNHNHLSYTHSSPLLYARKYNIRIV